MGNNNNSNNDNNNDQFLKVYDNQWSRMPVPVFLQGPGLQRMHHSWRILSTMVFHWQRLPYQQRMGKLCLQLSWGGRDKGLHDRVRSDPQLALRLPIPALGQDLLDLHH